MFTRNEGALDRVIRLVVGIGLGTATFTVLTGAWQIIGGIVAAILVVTALVGTCPLYALLHISTRRSGERIPTTTAR
jgi:hypothetical protein